MPTQPDRQGYNPFGKICALIVALSSAAVWWSWSAGVGYLLTSSYQLLPMAPSTAICLGLLSAAILLECRALARRHQRRWGMGLTWLVGSIGLLTLIRPWFGWDSPVEDWLTKVLDHIGDPHSGHIFPLTGGLLLAAAVAHGLQSFGPANRPLPGRLAAVLALGIVGVSLYVVIGYATNQPWARGSLNPPMALWTALSLAFLGSALLSEAPLFRGRGLGKAARTATPVAGDVNYPLIISVSFAVVIGIFTAVYLRHEQLQDRRDARKLLATIGKSKLAEILDWRNERLNIARFFAQADFVSQDVAMVLAHPESGTARTRLLRWLNQLKAGDSYIAVGLFDTNAVLHLATSEPTNPPLVISSSQLGQALRTHDVVISDIQPTPRTRQEYMDIVLPVHEPTSISDPVLDRSNSPPIGAILLRLDPHQFLYPLVQSWPIPSRTGETVLFHREGDEVVFLNDLRHRTNSAFRVRFPITKESRLPAVQAVLGRTGQLAGRDYRGVLVQADIRKVPDSSWFLASKVDHDEMCAGLRQQAWLTLVLTAVLAVAAGLLISLISKKKQAQRALLDLAAERQRLALAQRVDHLMKNASDAIVLSNEQEVIVEANDRMVQTYGYTLPELLGMRLSELRSPATRADFAEQSRQIFLAGMAVFETWHQRKDGSILPVEISSNVIEINGARYKLGILRDLSERKAHEREMERLSRLYATLSQVNQCIVRVRSREELFQEICRIAVEYAGFKVVWIGWREPGTPLVKLLARAGKHADYLDRIQVTTEDRPEGRGPVGTCLREGRASIFNDFIHDQSAFWHDAAVAHNLRAAASFPIPLAGKVAGAFTVYADEPGVFRDQEIILLEKVALAISFALEHLAQEAGRSQAEATLLATNMKLEAALASMTDAVFISDCAGRFIDFNEGFATFHKFKDKEECPKTLAEYPAFLEVRLANGEIAPLEQWAVSRALRGETAKNEEFIHHRKDTGETWVGSYSFAPIRDRNGVIVGSVCAGRDITDQKLAEAALGESEQQFRGFFEQAAVGMAQVGLDGRWLRANQKLCEITGYPLEELRRKTFHDITHPEDLAADLATVPKLLEGKLTNYVTEKRYLRKDGSIVPIKLFVSVARNAEGKPKHFISIVQDITARLQAEAALRTSEEHFRAMFELASIGMARSDLRQGQFLRVNRKMCAIIGYSADELLQLRFSDITYPDDRQRGWEAFKQLVEGTVPEFQLEKRYVRKDGAVIWVNLNVTIIRDAAGQPLQSMATIEDITERKKAEEQLRKLSRAVEQSPVSIVITNLRGEIEYVNPKFLSLTGYEMAELLGQNPRILKSGKTPTGEHKRLWETITRGETWRGDFKNRKKNGEIFWETACISPVLDEAGRITHFLAVKEDITDRRQAENRFRQLVDSNLQGVMFWNAKGGITGANDAFLDIIGAARGELQSGRINWIDLTPPEHAEADCHAGEEMAAKGVCTPYEKEFLNQAGERVPVLVGAAVFEDSPGEGVSFVIDLTERKKLERQFLRAQRMESIGTLAGGIAHDLNNMLTPILMSVSMLKDLARNEADLSLLETMESCARRGAALVRQVLSFARGLEGERVPVNPLHLMRDVVQVMQETLPKSIGLRFSPARDLWSVTGDPSHIHQVFMNLCVNARDAMPGGGQLSIIMENVLLDETYAAMNPDSRPGAYLLTRVEDTGMGIPAGIRDRIFEPFFTTKEIGKGTGLGLSTSLGIIKSHRGFINFTSEPGRGTKFQVYLPANVTEKAAEEVTVEQTPLPRGQGRLVLVVDDEESIRQITRGTLERYDYRVLVARHGAEAVALYAQHGAEIAVVLTDMMMPIMDGPALVVALKSMNSQVRIIGSSGLAANNSTAHTFGTGVQYVIAKPYTAQTMLKALEHVLTGEAHPEGI